MEKIYILLISHNDTCFNWLNSLLRQRAFVERCSLGDAFDSLKKKKADCVLLDGSSLPSLELLSFFYFSKKDLNCNTFILSSFPLDFRFMDPKGLLTEKSFIEPYSSNILDIILENASRKTALESKNAGSSSLMKDFMSRIQEACRCEVPVLLTGESGSGKGYYASFIHSQSARRNKPFIMQNMAELNPTLTESHLFGTEAHAYTGAAKTKGIFEHARGGSLFMDEIGEVPLSIQPKLLTVLDGKEIRPLGSQHPLSIDVRFIFATNRNLHQEVKKGSFRKDLLYRINTIEIEVPPLRAHKEDIPRLSAEFAACKNKSLHESALERLMEYEWPGNVRQLQSVVMTAGVSCSGDIITGDFIRLL